jgi:hypothetical protein
LFGLLRESPQREVAEAAWQKWQTREQSNIG